MNIFSLDPGLFFWSMITFLILVALLYKFAFNPLMRMQKARQDQIHQSIVEAEKLRDEAQELLVSYKQQLSAAREEAAGIVDRARKAGESSKAEVLEEARVQAEATLAKARQQIERDTNQALQRIREEAADLTIAATEKVARTSLSEEDQLRLIQEAINEIDLSKISEN
ncbi:MAG: F0F1 ATP synthase subunit B [Actinobacteria bacterium]|jgi:F-type H+-transporting ATPase subunit b|nr:F0F1 ATP synthase subunit B [Actinomycetota bacterium]